MLLLLGPQLKPHSRFSCAGETAASTSACRIARSIIFGDASSSSPRKYETSFDTPYPSVASRIRCRRLRAAIGAQSKAHRAANTERIGKRCDAAMGFDGLRRPADGRCRDTSTMPSPNLLWNTCMPERRPCEGAAFCGGLLRRHLRAGEGV